MVKMCYYRVYLRPKNMTMNVNKNLEILKDHLFQFLSLRSCQFFIHDVAPAHKTNLVQKWLHDYNIAVLERPGNSPDLNPIEKAWNHKKKFNRFNHPGSGNCRRY